MANPSPSPSSPSSAAPPADAGILAPESFGNAPPSPLDPFLTNANDRAIAKTHSTTGAAEARRRRSVLACKPTGTIPYKLLMPEEIASHNSLTLSRNAMMATMAITTSTPTKMAYSVVP